jgi:hypothetical protein
MLNILDKIMHPILFTIVLLFFFITSIFSSVYTIAKFWQMPFFEEIIRLSQNKISPFINLQIFQLICFKLNAQMFKVLDYLFLWLHAI